MLWNSWKSLPWRYKAAEVGGLLATATEVIRYSEVYRYNTGGDWSDVNRIIANIGFGMFFGYCIAANGISWVRWSESYGIEWARKTVH